MAQAIEVVSRRYSIGDVLESVDAYGAGESTRETPSLKPRWRAATLAGCVVFGTSLDVGDGNLWPFHFAPPIFSSRSRSSLSSRSFNSVIFVSFFTNSWFNSRVAAVL